MSTALQLAWTQLWQTAAVALAVAIVVQLIGRRRPHLAYLLWLVVIAKSLTPPIWSSPAGVFCWATIGRSAPSTVELPPANREPIVPSPAPTGLAATTVALPTASDPGGSDWPHSEWLTTTTVFALVWLAGTAILAAVLVANWLRVVGRLRRTALPLEPAWREQFAACARKLHLRRAIRFVVTSEPLGPAVCGVFRPLIVVPHSVFAKEPSALEAIVAHELVHVRRSDALAALFQTLAQCVWWFHPCVLWANRQANRERERACDEEVLATFRLEPAAYAQCLLDVLRMKQTLRPIVAFPGVRAIEVTTRRLEHIMQSRPTFHSRTPRRHWAIALGGALAALPGAAITLDAPSVASEQKAVPDNPQKDAGPPPIKRPRATENAGPPRDVRIVVDAKGMVELNFENAPWPLVVQEVARVSGMTLDWQVLPGDSLNLRSNAKYTIVQARDLVNERLFARGYSMLVDQKTSTILVVKLDDLNTTLVPRVAPDKLDGLPPYDLVKVVFRLEWLPADKAAEEFKSLLSPQAKLRPSKSTNRLEVIDIIKNVKELAAQIHELDVGGSVQSVHEFQLRYARAPEVLEALEAFVGTKKDAGAPPLGAAATPAQRPTADVRLAANPRRNSILVKAPPDQMALIRATIRKLDVSSTGKNAQGTKKVR